MNSPCNCSDPLSGAKEYRHKTEPQYIVRAKQMDRTFVVSGPNGLIRGQINDWLIKTTTEERPIYGMMPDGEFQKNYEEVTNG